jgi:ABC-2 type transport system permease protein
MNQVSPVFKREFLGYFRSPVAYVFLVVFSVAGIGLSFFVGQFFDAGTASLESYFAFYPWLFLFLIPAAGMRLWSEEKRTGTIELLFTLPITTLDAVLGKFIAAWAFLTLAILLSLPMAFTVAYLGDPDWGVIVSTYFGSILMAGGYLGVCSLMSAFTKNQVISFVLGVVACLILLSSAGACSATSSPRFSRCGSWICCRTSASSPILTPSPRASSIRRTSCSSFR